MSLVINTNIAAMDAHRNLLNSQRAMSTSMQRLSSGLRINSAADDAAGLAISENLTGQVNGLDQAKRNVQDGVSLVQTADGALSDVQQMLQRVRELAVQYQNGTLSTVDKNAITSEVGQLGQEIVRIGNTAQFNNISLFAGGLSTDGITSVASTTLTVTFQVGANDNENITVNVGSMVSLVSGIAASATFSLSGTAALGNLDGMINKVSTQRAQFGAVQNRLQYALDNLSTYEENLTAARSSIQDVDMASEMTQYTKEQILQQAGTAMLAQANQAPQSVLKLLQ